VPTPASSATTIATRTDFLWHQRFELAPGVYAPGTNDVDWLLHAAGVPLDLTGASVLDVGTTNGGTAFTLERRGAARVVATDIVDPMHFGFEAIREALGSSVEFRQLSVYELAQAMGEQFDFVIFWGVLYHLRHPLLALDNVRAVAGGEVYVETAVCDAETVAAGSQPLARFYRLDELGADSSNWFAPNVPALLDWCRSCGLEPQRSAAWPDGSPSRAMIAAAVAPGPPEYLTVSYERPLVCEIADLGLDGRVSTSRSREPVDGSAR
jgi:tRNA (mo5U34)-methyltransferase